MPTLSSGWRRLLVGRRPTAPREEFVSWALDVTPCDGTAVSVLEGHALQMTTSDEEWAYALHADLPAEVPDDACIVVEGRVEEGELGVLLIDDDGRRLQEVRMGPGDSVVHLGGPSLLTALDGTDLNPFDDFRARGAEASRRASAVVVRNCRGAGATTARIARFAAVAGPIDAQVERVWDWPFLADSSGQTAGRSRANSSHSAVIHDGIGVLRERSMAPSGAPTGMSSTSPFFLEAHEFVVLRALIDQVPATEPLRLASIGAGYGEWLTSAWRLRSPGQIGLLVAVEADARRVEWVRQHCRLNDVPSDLLQICHGAVGTADAPFVYMPTDQDPAQSFGASVRADAAAGSSWQSIPSLRMVDVLDPAAEFHIVQMDIQGAEVDALDALYFGRARDVVSAMVVSTHSAHGHNVLCERFVAEGWMLAISVPIGGIVMLPFPSQQDPLPSMAVDGLIVAINPRRASWTIPPPNKEYPRQ